MLYIAIMENISFDDVKKYIGVVFKDYGESNDSIPMKWVTCWSKKKSTGKHMILHHCVILVSVLLKLSFLIFIAYIKNCAKLIVTLFHQKTIRAATVSCTMLQVHLKLSKDLQSDLH